MKLLRSKQKIVQKVSLLQIKASNTIPHDTDQPFDWKKIVNVIEDNFTKIDDALVDL